MRALVTGAAGFTGSHVVQHLLEETDWDVVALDCLSYASFGWRRLRDAGIYEDPRLSCLAADFSKELTPGVVQEIGDVDYICHIGAETHVDRSVADALPFVLSNVLGTMWMLEFARTLPGLKRFIYFSTDEVFGPANNDRKFSDWDRYNSTNPYCLLPDSKIISMNGPIPIKDFNVKEQKVIAKYKGCWNSVGPVSASEKFKYIYKGKILIIETDCGVIRTTSEHRFFRKTKIINPLDKPQIYDIYDNPIMNSAYYKVQEIRAKELRKGDYILALRHIPFKNSRRKRGDDRLWRFLGYFVGDGSYNIKSRFARLADQKLEYIQFYRNLAKDIFGVSKNAATGAFGTIYKHGSKDCHYLQFSSKTQREIVDLSDKHRIVEMASSINGDCVAAYLAGFLDAEGHLRYLDGNLLINVTIFQADLSILENAQFLFRRLGIIGKISRSQNGHRLIITDNRSLWMIIDDIPSLKVKPNSYTRKAQHKNWNKKMYWSQIHKIIGLEYCGPVYDLEVPDRGNYSVDYYFVHNSASKAGGEELALAYSNTYDIPMVITHCCNIFGERQHWEKYIPMAVRLILAGEPVLINADRTLTRIGGRYYIHCRNVADALLWMLNNEDLPWCEKFNVTSKREVGNLEMAEIIAAILGKELRHEIVDPDVGRHSHDLRYDMDGTRLAVMGWTAPDDFEERLASTVKWYAENPEWLS